MIGSAADIGFNTFVLTMGPIVLVAWIVCLVMLKFLFKEELAEKPADVDHVIPKIENEKVWRASLVILGLMVILFMLHRAFHWEPWFVALLGMTALIFVSRGVIMDRAMEHVEITLLIFFLGLFMVIGGVGIMAAMSGVSLGEPPMPFFALLSDAPVWITLPSLVLAVTLVTSSVDTLQNGIASLWANGHRPEALNKARWLTVAIMLPVIVIALQGLSVLRLFLIADLLCAAIVVPVLLGLWQRMTPMAAISGGLAGLVGAVLPGWIGQGSVSAGVMAATFPGSVPTLGPFVGALLLSTTVSVALALVSRQRVEVR